MVLILGGGVGGLSAAYYLLKHGKKNVVLSEASNCLGGWVKTKKLRNAGVLVEVGPRTIRPTGPQGLNTLSLIEDLNLSNKVKPIPRTHPAARNRFIYAKNKLNALPSNIGSFFKKVPPLSEPLFFAFVKDFFTPVKHLSDESLYNFVERRLGKDIADYVVSPLVCGICAGDSKEISVKFLLPKLFEMEQKYGSISKGMYRTLFSKRNEPVEKSGLSERAKKEMWSVWMLEGGLQVLPNTLASQCKESGAELKVNSPCSEIKFVDNKVLCKIGKDEIVTEHVISSLPATSLARLLPKVHRTLSNELASIQFVTVAVVHLIYKGKVLNEEGFGFLVPPCEQLPILGVIFDSCCNPQEDYTILTVMMGGKWFSKYFGNNSKTENLLNTAVTHVKNILGISASLQDYNVELLKQCIPQYTVGHDERIDRINAYIKQKNLPLSLVGSSYHGVGLNDVILSSRKAVEQIIENQKKKNL